MDALTLRQIVEKQLARDMEDEAAFEAGFTPMERACLRAGEFKGAFVTGRLSGQYSMAGAIAACCDHGQTG